jgi:dihydrofolate reductase
MAGEGCLDHWRRTAREHPIEADYAFAARIGQLPKIVVSGRPVTEQWPNTTVMEGAFADAVGRAKETVAGDLVCFGGAGFVTALLRERLVDELQLYINPGLAGHGKTIFSEETNLSTFTLLGATPTECGMLIARWKPSTTTTTERNP